MWSGPFQSYIPHNGYAQHNDVANVEACMAMCWVDPICQAIEWKNGAECGLYDHQNNINTEYDNYSVYKLTRQFTGYKPCSRTRSGGCGNHASKQLGRFADRAYSIQECYALCKSTDECGGFFLGTSSTILNHCDLVQSGCTPNNDANWDYYSMDECTSDYPSVTVVDAGVATGSLDTIRNYCTQRGQQLVSVQDAGHIQYLKQQLLSQRDISYFTSGQGIALGYMYNNDHRVYDLNDASRDLSTIFQEAMNLGYITKNEADPAQIADQPWAGFGWGNTAEIHDWGGISTTKAVFCEDV